MQVSKVDGLVVDTPGAYDDQLPTGVVTPVLISARTSFLHLPVLEGFQRVRWLYLTASVSPAERSPTGISMRVDFDDIYGAVTPPGAPGSYTTSATQTAATFGTGGTIEFRHKLHHQKCKSVAFTFSNLTDATGILGLQAMALEVGFKRGTNKLAATQTVP